MALRLRPGSLAPALRAACARALASGALQPIVTDEERIADGAAVFILRSVASLARKAEAGTEDRGRNPFLPPEPELFVAEVSDRHYCLLNKYNVIDGHLLLVTRQFEHQETLLAPGDFEALAACMAEFEALAFYNGGAAAGASQPHKHLQLVPLPLAPDLPPVPLECLWPDVAEERIQCSPALPFRHALIGLPGEWGAPSAMAPRLRERYGRLLAATGIGSVTVAGELRQSAPYDLLLTRRWMLLVPRSRERYAGVSVNSLGFAGSLFVAGREKLDTLRRMGPMNLLREVALPA